MEPKYKLGQIVYCTPYWKADYVHKGFVNSIYYDEEVIRYSIKGAGEREERQVSDDPKVMLDALRQQFTTSYEEQIKKLDDLEKQFTTEDKESDGPSN